MRFSVMISFVIMTSCGDNALDTGRTIDGAPHNGNNGAAGSGNLRSRVLPGSSFGLFNPLPGGKLSGYKEDSGLDILANYKPTYAVASGTLVYSESGHTTWQKNGDTANSVLLKLDSPLTLSDKRRVTHIYYTHLSKLQYLQPRNSKTIRKVAAGEFLGTTGIANNTPHLHIGFLLDNEVAQNDPRTYLSYTSIRSLLGNYRNEDVLPEQ